MEGPPEGPQRGRPPGAGENAVHIRALPLTDEELSAILGGSIGALLGMRVFHHKTLHRSFRYGIPAILILQILIPVGIAIWRLLAG